MTTPTSGRLPTRTSAKPTTGATLGFDIAALVAQTVVAVAHERTEQARIQADHERRMRHLAARERFVAHAFDRRMDERAQTLDKLAEVAAQPAVVADPDCLATVVDAMVGLVTTSPFDGLPAAAASSGDEPPGPVIEGELA